MDEEDWDADIGIKPQSMPAIARSTLIDTTTILDNQSHFSQTLNQNNLVV